MTRASTGSCNYVSTIYLLTGHIHVGISMSHTFKSIFYRVIYLTLYMTLTPPPPPLQILLPNYNLSEWHAHCCFWVAFQHKSRISPLDLPLTPHPTSCMHLVAHNHACPFLFSESRIFRPKIQGNTCILSRFLYPILYSWVQPPSIFDPEKPHTNPCLTSIIINFKVSFPLSCFFTSVTRISPYTSTL